MTDVPRSTGSPGRPSLGVVAICYNEQDNMRPFLEHLVPWVDEIVLVDDGSTDGTAGIAAQHPETVTFIESPRAEDEYFSHQRNKGIRASKSDWLLHMDVDERVSPDLATEIVRLLATTDRQAFRFRRLNHFMNRPMTGGGWQTWNQVHLARREVLRFGGMYHESIELTCNDSQTGQLSGLMYHLNEMNLRHRLRKSDTYLEEILADVEQRHPRINALHLATLPALEFVKRYFFKRGFMDGVPGWISAVHSGTAMFRACAITWERQNPVSRQALEDAIRREWEGADLAHYDSRQESQD